MGPGGIPVAVLLLGCWAHGSPIILSSCPKKQSQKGVTKHVPDNLISRESHCWSSERRKMNRETQVQGEAERWVRTGADCTASHTQHNLPAPLSLHSKSHEGGHPAVQTVLDEMGASAGCTTLNQDQELVVGRPEAVYFYTPDGRGPCFVLEGLLSLLGPASASPPTRVHTDLASDVLCVCH